MPPDKTDPLGATLNKHAQTLAGIAAFVLLVVGPASGFTAARLAEPSTPCADHTREIAALSAKVDSLTAAVGAAALADVQLRSDVARLADTIGEVRKIEEQAHPRFRSQPQDP